MFVEDSDMKIVGQEAPQKDDHNEVEELRREEANGNLARARALGAWLVRSASTIEISTPIDDKKLIAQRWLLLLFTVESQLARLLPTEVSAQTAQNEFYNSLRTDAPHIYEELQQNGGLTFYYLCLQQDDVPTAVANTFASLYGKPQDPAMIEMGKALYNACVYEVGELVAEQKFVK
ncbi:MAG: hypothetical protein IIX68_04025 [Clostridia bacterium]|nr:hypothetical protein [Clostridia bacterium]